MKETEFTAREDIGGQGGAHDRQYRWIMLGLLWMLYAAFGLVSRSIFPLVTPILKDLGLSYSQMGLILGSWQLTYILASLAAGPVLDRYGARRSLLAGALIMAFSSALRLFADGFGLMLAAVALFGAGGPMISIGGPKVISEWFRGRGRGTAVGIYMIGPGIGGLMALSLTNSLVMPLAGSSWRLTFVIYGVLTAAVGLLWWFTAREINRPSASSAEDPGIIEVFRGLIRVPSVQIILAMALLSFAVAHGFGSWLPRILETGGLSPSAAGFAASIPLAASIPALILIPRLTPPDLRGRALAVSALAAGASLLIVVKASGGLLVFGLVLLGAAGSSFMPLMILILMDTPEVGARYMGSAGGMFFCVAEIGGFGGPWVLGYLKDLTGTFLVGTLFLAGLCAAVFALTFLLRGEKAPA